MKNHSNGIYFGWYIVIISMVITTLTVGLRSGIGPFVFPIMHDFSISRTFMSLIISVSMLMYGVGMPIAGYLCEKYNTKFILLLGLVLIEVSLFISITTNHVWLFFIMYGAVLSLGLAFTSPVAMTPIISKWFEKNRGRALFLLYTGSMAGIAIFNPLANFLIQILGWRLTLFVFSIIFIILIIPSAFYVFYREYPQDNSDNINVSKSSKKQLYTASLKQVLYTKNYWKIVFGLFACGFSMNLLGTHAIPMLIDHNFTSSTASYAIGLIGGIAIISTILLSLIADHYSKSKLLSIIYFIRGLGFLGLVLAQTTEQLYIVAILGGLVWSGSIALSSAILADLYGTKLLGILYGWAYLGHQI